MFHIVPWYNLLFGSIYSVSLPMNMECGWQTSSDVVACPWKPCVSPGEDLLWEDQAGWVWLWMGTTGKCCSSQTHVVRHCYKWPHFWLWSFVDSTLMLILLELVVPVEPVRFQERCWGHRSLKPICPHACFHPPFLQSCLLPPLLLTCSLILAKLA